MSRPVTKNRTKQISMRLSESEYQLLKYAKENSGLTLPDFIALLLSYYKMKDVSGSAKRRKSRK